MADKSGYCYKFEMYTGNPGEASEKGLGEKVVLKLCQGFENKGHKLFFDNYFISIQLMETLRNLRIFVCVTVNPNRKELSNFRCDKDLKQGDFDYFTSKNGIYIVQWKDKRCVHLTYNYHQLQGVTKVDRKAKTGATQEIPCPAILVDYNANMNSADKSDQMKACQEIDRKSKKWSHRVFFHFELEGFHGQSQ